MSHPDPILYEIQRMINDLSLINRKSYLAKTDRHENDIEHSVTVAILCWHIHDKYAPELDISKILKYSLTHDFVERYAGDVSTFASSAEREAKVIREKESLARLTHEFAEFPDLIASMEHYETKDDEEALFVWSVDKMQQLINGDISDWKSYAEAEISYESFSEKYKELCDKSSKYARDIFYELIEFSKGRYYDRPNIEAMNKLYEEARSADENGTLNEWMVAYLRDSGRNATLAEGIEAEGDFHTHLIDYPIDKFKILMGPDTSYRYYETPVKFNARVDAMVKSLEEGWKPVPFVASDIWNDGLELNDGSHRVAALKRCGIKVYPTVFYFKNQTELDAFLDTL